MRPPIVVQLHSGDQLTFPSAADITFDEVVLQITVDGRTTTFPLSSIDFFSYETETS